MSRANVWTLCSNINVLDVHVYTTESDMSKIELIKKEIKRKLEKYDIKHATLEFECEECAAIFGLALGIGPDQAVD